MVKFNSAYLFPFGLIKGPEIFFSLVSWSLSSDLSASKKNAVHKEERTFLLIIGVIICVLVTIWFLVNLLWRSIKGAPRVYVVLGAIHFIFGGIIIAAGASAVNEAEYCRVISWWPYVICENDNTLIVSGSFGIITGILLIIDAFIHVYERNRQSNNNNNTDVASSTKMMISSMCGQNQVHDVSSEMPTVST